MPQYNFAKVTGYDKDKSPLTTTLFSDCQSVADGLLIEKAKGMYQKDHPYYSWEVDRFEELPSNVIPHNWLKS